MLYRQPLLIVQINTIANGSTDENGGSVRFLAHLFTQLYLFISLVYSICLQIGVIIGVSTTLVISIVF